jgi:hypothetical protein
MRRGASLAAIARPIIFAILLSALAVASPTPAAAQSTSEYRVQLDQLQLDMRALWGEIDRFQPKASYCNPPYGPLKQPDEMMMAAYSARVQALLDRYVTLRTSLTSFLAGNNRLAAELMLNGSDPLDPRWWQRFENERNRLVQMLNDKAAALKRAPVRNCGPRTQAAPQVQPDKPAPSLPQAATYEPVGFPTVPTHFCSQDEYWRFINDVINPEYLRAAENAEKAAAFRASVERAVNGYVQAGRPIPADLAALRRRAQSDYAEQQRLSDEIAKLRDRARHTPVTDCSKQEQSHGSVATPRGEIRLPGDSNGRLYRTYSAFADARDRCDRAAMAAALTELEDMAKEARESAEGIADSMQGGPLDQADTPENHAYWEAEADRKTAEQLLARARAAQARCPCNPLTPTIQAAVPAAPSTNLQDAQRSVARWVGDSDRLFDELAAATQAHDCARIQAAISRIAKRFEGQPKIWWAVVPPEFLLKWRLLYLRAREACRPPAREKSDSILDSIDEVPVIAQVPPDPTSAALLAYHNQVRAQAGSVPLRWNATLAAHAGDYAKVIAESGQLQHSTRQGREGERENISLGIHRTSSPMAMVQTWGKEQRLFRPGVFPDVCSGDWSQCAHYTQMVWSTTTDVGCAFASGRQFDALVCRYSPPGNRDGRPVLGVLPIKTTQPCPTPLVPLRGRAIDKAVQGKPERG